MSKWKGLTKKANILSAQSGIMNESYRTKLFRLNTDSFNGGSKHLKGLNLIFTRTAANWKANVEQDIQSTNKGNKFTP